MVVNQIKKTFFYIFLQILSRSGLIQKKGLYSYVIDVTNKLSTLLFIFYII